MDTICGICNIKSKAASKLNEAQIEKLSFNCAFVRFRKGDAIIRQGIFSTNVAYLRSGLAKVHISGPYYEQIVRMVKAPGYLGLPTTIGEKINQYSVTAIDDSEVCYIDIATFLGFLKENSDFYFEIMMELCRNELEVYNRCANRTQKQMRGKIADVLLEFADRIYDSDTFTLPITQLDFGNLVDASRESVSRILAEFEKDGIISCAGRDLKILKKDSLRLISANG